ncbi:hypothetical protein BJ912DRAFT_1012917 [Pholiota molesta]|nr:hypothetical protein BJ912DRAFT_1012917 [Pholiota molesta]
MALAVNVPTVILFKACLTIGLGPDESPPHQFVVIIVPKRLGTIHPGHLMQVDTDAISALCTARWRSLAEPACQAL